LDENKFNSIFPSLLKVLEDVTEFFKESHAAEIFRVIETCDDTFVQAKNLLNIDTPAMLVPQAKLLKLRAEECKTNVTNLLFVQESVNKNLIEKFNLAQALLEETITPFIMASKEVLTNVGDNEKKDLQKVQYESAKSCIDEIKRILELVKAKFNADWNAEKKAAKEAEWGKSDPARKLLKALANNKFPNNPVKAQKALDMIPTHTKNLFNEINPPPEQKKAIVDNVKAARDGTIPEYFDAVQNLEKLVKPQTLKIEMKSGDATNKMDTNRGNLLRAAKEMCMAMKDVNAMIQK